MARHSFLFFFLCFGLVGAHAGEVMFDGYYRVELQGKHIGYVIQRFEFDAQSKTFESKSFLRAKFGDKLVQESTVAKSSDKFKPISYQYTSQIGDTLKAVDATFNGDIMKATFNDGKKVRTETSKLTVKGTFLSSFLPYLMLQRKLAIGDNFQYSAVAEEEGASYNGKTLLQSKEQKPGYETFTILNRFKGEEFVSKMAIIKDPKTGRNVKGEVFSTISPVKGVSTQLVASPELATEGQVVPNKTLMKVFGAIPTGKLNLVASPASVNTGSDSDAPATKKVDTGPALIPSPVPSEKGP